MVDDDEAVLESLSEQLRCEGYDVVASSTAQHALEFLAAQSFAVVISDQKMPGMLGTELLTEAKRLQPHASRILITGILSADTVIDAINQGEIFRFLAKPWLRAELRATVNNAVSRHDLTANNAFLQIQTARLNEDLQAKLEELESRPAWMPSSSGCCAISPSCAVRRTPRRHPRPPTGRACSPGCSGTRSADRSRISTSTRCRTGPTVTLAGAEGRHVAKVRRIRPGELVDVTDGRGTTAHCEVLIGGPLSRPRSLRTRARGAAGADTPDRRRAGAREGARGELAVETLTEVGG